LADKLKSFHSIFLGLLALSVAAAFVSAPAVAQDLSNLEITVTPYLWGGAPHSTINTPLPNTPKVHSDSSFPDVVGHLDWIPFMGAFEIRQGDFGFLGDFMHVPVGTNITTKNILFNGGTANLTEDIGTAVLMYRPYTDSSQSLDVGGGVRAWGFSAGLNLNGRLLPSVSLTRGSSWADALFAIRYHLELGEGFGLTGYGDVGGGGANVDWQALGTIDYKTNSWLTLRAGYRAIGFDFQSNNRNLGFNVVTSGPILAGTIQF
jgi:hypothetical protein